MALRAGAVFNGAPGELFERFNRNTGKRGCLFDERHQPRVSQAVVNIAALAQGFHPACLAQQHQVLRYACLAQPQCRHHVAHAGGLLADDHQDLDACRLAEKIKEGGDTGFACVRHDTRIIAKEAAGNKVLEIPEKKIYNTNNFVIQSK